MPYEIPLDPLNPSQPESADPLESPLTTAANAWAAREGFHHDQDDAVQPTPDADPVVQQIEGKHAAELDRIIATPIKADDPAFKQLASNRRADVYAHQRRLPAVGADPDEGFIEPEGGETYAPAPTPSFGFVIARKPRRPRAPK